MNWQAIFNDQALSYENEYEKNRGEGMGSFTHLMNQVANAFNLDVRGLDILDLGCGTGWLCRHLEGYRSYLGVDFAEEMTKIARQLATPNARFIYADVKEWKPEDEFDLVFMLGTSQYLSLDDLQKILKRISNRLRAGGSIIVQFRNVDSLSKLIIRLSALFHSITYNYYFRRDFQRIAGITGLEITSSLYMTNSWHRATSFRSPNGFIRLERVK